MQDEKVLKFWFFRNKEEPEKLRVFTEITRSTSSNEIPTYFSDDDTIVKIVTFGQRSDFETEDISFAMAQMLIEQFDALDTYRETSTLNGNPVWVFCRLAEKIAKTPDLEQPIKGS